MENKIQKTTTSLEKQLRNGLRGSTAYDICSWKPAQLHPHYMLLMEISTSLSMQKALEAPKLYQMKTKMTEPEIVAMIALNIRYFCDAMNVKENMNMIQVLDTSFEFLKTYSHDSLKDLILCLKKARNGQYGEIYNRIDQQVIMIFWQKYQEEKSIYLENQHLDTKARESTKPLLALTKVPEGIKQQLNQQLDQFMKQTASGYIAQMDQRKDDGDTLQQYLADLEQWMTYATDEEIEDLRKEAETQGAKAIVEALTRNNRKSPLIAEG